MSDVIDGVFLHELKWAERVCRSSESDTFEQRLSTLGPIPIRRQITGCEAASGRFQFPGE